jgi:hypothetical protein
MNIETLKKRFAQLGYKWDDRFNIIGIRSSDYKPNQFCDLLIVFNNGVLKTYSITTRPGRHWLVNLLNPKGAAVLKPGQYVNAYRLGQHRGLPALVQVQPVTVYRDNDRDELAEAQGQLDTGLFGINIHRANSSLTSKLVDRWSAGCQVMANPFKFDEFLKDCRDSGKGFFTYTLLNE